MSYKSNRRLIEKSALNYGDVKSGFQASDHFGWIKLDGRATSGLTTSQQARATALGFTVNLPNATDKYLSQTTAGALGDTNLGNANNQITLAQNNLPNVQINGTSVGVSYPLDDVNGPINTLVRGSRAGIYSQNTALIPTRTDYLSGGVSSQVPKNIAPATMKVNQFVYLGD